ncbi:HAMP domain-containing sensor histidine kinase [Paenibacillus sp. UMB4589-SE434]|uniref:HAMP domain-containing sensor histidine kinase n=1 Tax=Paenibacillus sp. UMB4589-SE434 TaxID=3046314 RepID=UPI00254BA96E|nr:HAMP domain-containing sensor histidine kinase [Paenibacillus sp. UMB4589-SE434]MDK8183157.1 HAMP domain-containing sensor histidine kinase [Paenibacillus sp. UMB4589-SE434]
MSSQVRWRQSLRARYLLIIFCALALWIIVFPILAILMQLSQSFTGNTEPNPYASNERMEKHWHDTAASLGQASPEQIAQQLTQLKSEYPKASMFWVDGSGHTRDMLPVQAQLPKLWTAVDSISFMKKSYDRDPYTIVSFIGKQPEKGFMVMQLPRKLMGSTFSKAYNYNWLLLVQVAIYILFVMLSWQFFKRIRNRLVRLEEAMTFTDDNGIPHTLQVVREDEIGQVEHAFNRMIDDLRTSRQREQEEEHLRKKLIANLSHDIRTPLTTIRAHAHSLKEEPLSAQGMASITLMDTKINDLGHLVDNLLSYTLLAAKRYTLQLQPVDIVRLIRESAANWYPVLEQEKFDIEIDLPDHAIMWCIDPQWMKRIMDNLIQNVVRHAAKGRYIGIQVLSSADRARVVITDKGPGMQRSTDTKGSGIGMSIVTVMLQDMRLVSTVRTGEYGTVIEIAPEF